VHVRVLLGQICMCECVNMNYRSQVMDRFKAATLYTHAHTHTHTHTLTHTGDGQIQGSETQGRVVHPRGIFTCACKCECVCVGERECVCV